MPVYCDWYACASAMNPLTLRGSSAVSFFRVSMDAVNSRSFACVRPSPSSASGLRGSRSDAARNATYALS